MKGLLKHVYVPFFLIFICNNLCIHGTDIKVSQEDDLIRNTTSGPVKGEIKTNLLSPDEHYLAFNAVPYALPPTGPLRFQPPNPPIYNQSIYDASDSSKYRCCQQPDDMFGMDLKMDEDCLLLSVYTPPETVTDNNKLPVLVWIHGGSFMSGCGMYSFAGPERIMKGNDVVLVSINYRLGNFGFLSLADSGLIGNMGLKDQTLALEWVQNNILQFGGDPNKVTIMGESAGSWAVFYQMMSPYSANLFQQVIGHSGSVLSPGWHEYTEDEAKRWGQLAAEGVGCINTEGISQQIECLQAVDAEVLRNARIVVGHMGPQAVVDSAFSDDPFLPDHPKQMMSSGLYNKEVSVLLGTNRDEGLLTTYQAIENNTIFKQWQDQWETGLGELLMFGIDPSNLVNDEEKIHAALDKVTKFYLGELSNMNIMNVHSVTQMFTDATFAYGVHDFITTHLKYARPNSIFQYMFAHEGEYSLTTELSPKRNAPYGICHGDELFLVFYQKVGDSELDLNAADTAVSNTLMELWKNFIKSGNASTDEVMWNPIDKHDNGAVNREYLRLTYAESSYMEYPKEWVERMELWEEVMSDLENNGTTTRNPESTTPSPASTITNSASFRIPSLFFALLVLVVL